MLPKISRTLQQFSTTEMSVLLRMFGAYLCTVGAFFAVSSQWLGTLMDHSFVGPIGFNSFPLVLLGLLTGVFMLVARKQFGDLKKIGVPHWIQIVIGLLILGACLYLSYWATHPSLERFVATHQYIQKYPTTGGPKMAAMLYCAMMSPFVGFIILLLPWNLLKRCWGTLLFGYLLYTAFLFGNVIEAQYHMSSSAYTLGLSSAILSIFPGESFARPEALELSYRGFRVTVGPVCSGLTMLILFIGFYAFMWAKLTSAHAARHFRAIAALILGLAIVFVLNVIRIVLIMIVGSIAPGFGVAAFHSIAGAVLFFIDFLLYLKFVVPWIRRT